MQMSLSGFLTFIYPHAAHYSRVENCKLERERTNGIEPDTENENKIKKKKRKKVRNAQHVLKLYYYQPLGLF